MTNMFKKSLVAMALAGVTTSAMAAPAKTDVLTAFGETVLSAEYVSTAKAGDGATVVSASATVAIDANYANNDTAVISFSGAIPQEITISNSGRFSGGACQDTSIDPDPSNAESQGTANVISNVNQETGEAVIRFTNIEGDTTGCEFYVSAIYNAADVTANSSVSYQARLGNSDTLIGKKGEVKDFVSVYEQFADLRAEVSLNRQIDVATQRQLFVTIGEGTEANATTVTGKFSVRNGLPASGPASFSETVRFNKILHTVTGDFSWLLDEDGELLEGAESVVTAQCNDIGKAPVADSVVLTESAYSFACVPNDPINATQPTPASVTFDVEDLGLRIPSQTFALSSVVEFSNAANNDKAGTKSLTEIEAGEWSLNGSQVYISYLPFGSGLTQVINLTNRSNQDGEVSVVAYDEAGRDFDLGVIAESKNGSISRLARNVYDALQDKTPYDIGGSTTRRFAFEVTTNAPAGEVEIYSAYNSSTAPGARVVVNSSNGAK